MTEFIPLEKNIYKTMQGQKYRLVVIETHDGAKVGWEPTGQPVDPDKYDGQGLMYENEKGQLTNVTREELFEYWLKEADVIRSDADKVERRALRELTNVAAYKHEMNEATRVIRENRHNGTTGEWYGPLEEQHDFKPGFAESNPNFKICSTCFPEA